MDWWLKLKELIGRGDAGKQGRASDREHPRLPAFILALCSTSDESAFSVEITSLSVTGLKLRSPRRLAQNIEVSLRVPVGLNFENRDTTEYVRFSGRTLWSQRSASGSGYDAGMRYLEEENDKRDKWIQLVLGTYGISMADDRRGRDPRHPVRLPVVLHRADNTEVPGEVRNISTGGLLASCGLHLQPQERIAVDLMPADNIQIRGVAAHIVHGHAEPEGGGWIYGIAFDELEAPRRDALVTLVTSLSRKAVSESGGAD